MRFFRTQKSSGVESVPAANLGQEFFYVTQLIQNLATDKIVCSDTRVISPDKIEQWLAANGLDKKIKKYTQTLDIHQPQAIRAVSERIAGAIMRQPLSRELSSELKKIKATNCRLLFTHASAGDYHVVPQIEWSVNAKNIEQIFKKAVSQFYAPEVMLNREQHGYGHTQVSAAIVWYTRSVRAERYTIHTSQHGIKNHIASVTVERSSGSPDTYLFFKPNIRTGDWAFLNVLPQSAPVIPAEIVSALAQAIKIETTAQAPLIVTAYFDPASKNMVIVGLEMQTPVNSPDSSEEFILTRSAKSIVHGTALGKAIAVGTARIINAPHDYQKYLAGEIIVAKKYSPECDSLIALAGGFIFESSSVPAEFAAKVRGLNSPCILDAGQAVKIIKSQQTITLSCAQGETGFVYAGALPYEVKKTPAPAHHKTGIESVDRIISFDTIIETILKVHPLSVCSKKSTVGNGTEKYTEAIFSRVAESAAFNYPEILTIALSTAPRRMFEDLAKGKKYEAKLRLRSGARGAERYLSAGYEPVVAAECRALVFLKEKLQLKNIRLQLPYCRSPFELEKVLALLQSHGVARAQGWKFSLQTNFPGHGLLTTSLARQVDTLVFDIDTLVPGIIGERVTMVTPEIQKTVESVLAQIVRSARQSKTDIAVSGTLLSRQPKLVFSTIKSGVRSIVTAPDRLVTVRASVIEAEQTVGNTGYATNQRWLGLVAGLAVFGGILMSVGAGCGFNERVYTEGSRGETQQMTPAQIRAEITAAVEANQREQDKKNPTVSTINGFAHFKIAYPKSWMAEYKPDGLILSDTETNTSLTFYKQIIKNNPAPESVTPLIAAGHPARFFPITTNSTTPPTFLYEVIMPNNSILEIASPASDEIINEIISSIIFLPKN